MTWGNSLISYVCFIRSFMTSYDFLWFFIMLGHLGIGDLGVTITSLKYIIIKTWKSYPSNWNLNDRAMAYLINIKSIFMINENGITSILLNIVLHRLWPCRNPAHAFYLCMTGVVSPACPLYWLSPWQCPVHRGTIEPSVHLPSGFYSNNTNIT